MLDELTTMLRKGKSWLDMSETVRRQLANAVLSQSAPGTYSMEVVLEGLILQAAQEDLNLHGLNLNLRTSDLMVSHTEAQKAARHANTFAGFANLGNTCFVNATL